MPILGKKKRVGILRGGEEDYENSLYKGGEVFLHIFENLADRWLPQDILIDLSGVWHLAGLPIQPIELPNKVDVIWNTTHPSFSGVVENLRIPNVGPSSFSRALADNHLILAKHLQGTDLKVSRQIVLPVYQEDFDGPREKYSIKKAKEVHEKFSPPWLVKSLIPDPDLPVRVAKTFSELVEAIEDGVNHQRSILVEEFISNRKALTYSVSGFREQNVYVFPPVGNFNKEEKEKLISLTKDLRRNLNVQDYLQTNFVLHPQRGIFLSGLYFSPNLKIDSDFHRACQSVGTKMHEIVEHMLESVL